MMKERILQQLKQDGYQSGDTLLLALSAGIDSMFLWHLVLALNLPHAIAHVNYQLRGVESDSDEKFLSDLAKKRRIAMHKMHADTTKLAEDQGLSIQMAARDIRYTFFEQLKKEHAYSWVCTAHHVNDSLETLLLNLNRGSGIAGLAGIQSQDSILRPMQTCSRYEIERYVKENRISFREDASNQDLKYDRNWFRHEIISKWQERNPALQETMKGNFKRIQTAVEAFNWAIEEDCKACKIELSNEEISIDTIKSLRFPSESLWALFKPMAFRANQIQEMQQAILNQQQGKRWESASHFLFLDRNHLFCAPLEKKSEAEQNAVIYKFQESIDHPILLRFAVLPSNEFMPSQKKEIQFFDFNSLQFPLILRKWKPGDRMSPLGMKGKKKISDILIDSKVPQHEKDQVFVLLSGEEIVWMLGAVVSENFKVKTESKQILRIDHLGSNLGFNNPQPA